jgi:hypothetical protein
MCVVSGAVAGAAAINATLAISAVTGAASIAMGIASQQQQAQQAAAQQAMASQQFAAQQSMQILQQQSAMQMQAQQQQAQMQLAQSQQLSSAQFSSSQFLASQRQQAQQMMMQQQQSNARMAIEAQQLRESQAMQQRTSMAQMELQRSQVNAQIINANKQQQRQVINQRAQIIAQDEIDRTLFQSNLEEARDQNLLNNEAANRTYVAEQAKLNEVRQEALFEQQNIIARSIGAKGSILATGRSGQSIGLLLQDVDRQAGFAEAQEMASLDSARDQAIIAMDAAYLENQSSNNKAASSIGAKPKDPYLPKMPDNPTLVGLGIENPYI